MWPESKYKNNSHYRSLAASRRWMHLNRNRVERTRGKGHWNKRMYDLDKRSAKYTGFYSKKGYPAFRR